MGAVGMASWNVQMEDADMKRFIPLLFLLVLPAALFAQTQPGPETQMLKQLGLNDSQISQVTDIQKNVMTTIRQDRVHIRLLQAQIAQALLPAKVDMQAVNDLINQAAQSRADIQKALVGAQVQLRQLMGDDNYRAYMRRLMAAHRSQKRGRARGAMDGVAPWAWGTM